MKNIELITDLSNLRKIDFKEIKNTKLQYGRLKNFNKLESEVNILNKTIEELAPEEFLTLKKEISPIVLKAIEDNEKKSPQEIEIEIIKNWDKKDKWEELVAKYNKLITAFHMEENDFQYFNLKLSDIENTELNEEQMKVILPFVIE